MIKTRFAPSPTGYLHVGNIRSGLYSYLFAKKHGGKLVLRIEDTDRERHVEDGVESILKILAWIGIVPDEGPQLEGGKIVQIGENGPYIQSERLEIYKKYAQELLEAGHAYYCFCTSERLEKLRADQQAKKRPTGYDGHCLSVDPKEAKQKVEVGEKHVIRLKMLKSGETVFNDMIRGEVRFKNELVDDQVLIKSDGFPTYHFAVVVDDHLMGITNIIRGDEWISSVPKHVQLYKYFGWEVPQMAHLPLMLNPDKSKLSKRQGDVATEDYRKKGYLPEALINFMAFLGWNPGTEKEIYTLDELIADFDLAKVGKTGAVFNIEKLNWYNKQYIKQLSNEQLLELSIPWLKEAKFEQYQVLSSKYQATLPQAVGLERERITTLSELPEAIRFVFDLPGYKPELLIWKKSSHEEVKNILPQLVEFFASLDENDFAKQNLEEKTKAWIAEKGLTVGSVLWPMRVALSGQENSPGPFEIAEVLGKKETITRLQLALDKI